MIGVNFFGDLHGEGSLSEVARTTLDAIRRQDIPFTYNELLYPYAMYRTGQPDPRFLDLPSGHPYPANLLCYNMHLFDTISDERLRNMTGGGYVIGQWVWEMPDVPEIWQPQFARVDEIWCPSSFTARSFQKITDASVIVAPHSIDLHISPNASRAMFGLPEHRMIFLFTFSAGSGDGRKNPWGVIEAFRRAFGMPSDDSPLLVMKTQHSADYPEVMEPLSKALDEVGGILIPDTYTRQQMNDLFSVIDCYVSLHRAEGFGLGMAEAMACGKAVIGTAYSGNVDFMTPENSYRVDFTLRPVQPDDHRYRQELLDYYRVGWIWAEPDVDHAASLMRQVYEHPEEGRARGERAAAHMRDHFSPAAVGAIMAERIRCACEASS
jgi:glycosyltransferase involved in cell wall biosynthesis